MFITRGMHDNPPIVAIFGDGAKKRRQRFGLFMGGAARALGWGSNMLVARGADGEITGVCSIMPPGECLPSPSQQLRMLPSLLSNGSHIARRTMRLLAVWTKRDPAERHWHLGPLVVDAHLQGMGVGSRLMQVFLVQMDAAREDVYLETYKPENIRFYKRFGFEVIGEQKVFGVTNYFMLRRPEGRHGWKSSEGILQRLRRSKCQQEGDIEMISKQRRQLMMEEKTMRVGFTVPQFGPGAGPDALLKVAQLAEDLGSYSLWVAERLLYPTNPKSPYPATPDGSLPPPYRRSLDPLAILAYLAAATSQVRIGAFINLTFHNPVILARELSTIDVLSHGRLDLGFGVGWSSDEFEAVGVPMQGRGQRAEEALRVIEAIWRENPVEFEGRYFRVPESYFDLKPVQKPRPPVYMGAYTPATMSRVARVADGWLPTGLPLEAMEQMFAAIKQEAAEAGREPDSLKLTVIAHADFHPAPLGEDRPIFAGSAGQIEADILATRRLGADEIIFNVLFSPDVASTEDVLSRMEQLWTMTRRSEQYPVTVQETRAS